MPDLIQDHGRGGKSLLDDTIKACAKLPKNKRANSNEDLMSDLSETFTPHRKLMLQKKKKQETHVENVESKFSSEVIRAFKKQIADIQFFKSLQLEL